MKLGRRAPIIGLACCHRLPRGVGVLPLLLAALWVMAQSACYGQQARLDGPKAPAAQVKGSAVPAAGHPQKGNGAPSSAGPKKGNGTSQVPPDPPKLPPPPAPPKTPGGTPGTKPPTQVPVDPPKYPPGIDPPKHPPKQAGLELFWQQQRELDKKNETTASKREGSGGVLPFYQVIDAAALQGLMEDNARGVMRLNSWRTMPSLETQSVKGTLTLPAEDGAAHRVWRMVEFVDDETLQKALKGDLQGMVILDWPKYPPQPPAPPLGTGSPPPGTVPPAPGTTPPVPPVPATPK